jgi:MFS family permease
MTEDPDSQPRDSERHNDNDRTKLPLRQMSILCFCCFCEQSSLLPQTNRRVAFNSTPSYTYFMVERFNIAHRKSDIGFYLGLITTSFLASQSLANPFWGWISDRLGRKPVVMIGTLGTCIGFLLFGFAETYTWVSF